MRQDEQPTKDNLLPEVGGEISGIPVTYDKLERLDNGIIHGIMKFRQGSDANNVVSLKGMTNFDFHVVGSKQLVEKVEKTARIIAFQVVPLSNLGQRPSDERNLILEHILNQGRRQNLILEQHLSQQRQQLADLEKYLEQSGQQDANMSLPWHIDTLGNKSAKRLPPERESSRVFKIVPQSALLRNHPYLIYAKIDPEVEVGSHDIYGFPGYWEGGTTVSIEMDNGDAEVHVYKRIRGGANPRWEREDNKQKPEYSVTLTGRARRYSVVRGLAAGWSTYTLSFNGVVDEQPDVAGISDALKWIEDS